jgi:hypothetical protein
MSVVALGSIRSCGVTTLALALAATWPTERRVLIVEADPAGGTLAGAGGWPPEPGLVSLAAATRRVGDLSAVFEHCHMLPGGAQVLAAPASGEQTRHALSMLEGVFAGLGELDADVFLDCGRLEPTTAQGTSSSGAIASLGRFAGADRALLVVRPRLPDLHALGSWLSTPGAASITASGRLGLVLVGDGPYSNSEIIDALGVEVLGDIPFDPEAVTALAAVPASDRALRQAPLVRSARTLAEHLAGSILGPVEPALALASATKRTPFAALRQWRSGTPVAAVNGSVSEGIDR